MHQYKTFVSELDTLLAQALHESGGAHDQIALVLDGKPAHELRRLVPLEALRSSGAFFTGSVLSNLAIAHDFSDSINSTSVILDPTCGGGDLLLSTTPFLPRSPDLTETLDLWGLHLKGLDLYPEFVKTARLRLMLKAISLGAKPNHLVLDSCEEKLTGIKAGSTFQNIEIIGEASHILLNPPYNMVDAPETCEWGDGKVNSAALFLEACVKNSQVGTRIVAILPDVLRSGTRYEKWRKVIGRYCEIKRVDIYGQFDAWADVDVFILNLVIKEETSASTGAWALAIKNSITVGDKFEISIGPVVDYRDSHSGQMTCFIHPRNILAWEQVEIIENTRSFSGRTFASPFVVIRRTSRPGDRFRAVGTIINSLEKVAVENHLIVLKPKDGSLSACQNLLRVLKSGKTNEWLNERIRCRHLTVKALAELPWWSEDDDQ